MSEILTNAKTQIIEPQIKAIESVLVRLCDALIQEKADIGTAGWTTANELAHIATELEQVHAFWTQTGPEYT